MRGKMVQKARIKMVKPNKVMMKGVRVMEVTVNEENIPRLTYMSDLKRMMQDEMKRLGITPSQMRKSLGVKKYEEEN